MPASSREVSKPIVIATFRQVKKAVHTKVRESTMRALICHVKANEPRYWGEQKQRIKNFVELMVYATVFKDTMSVSFENVTHIFSTDSQASKRSIIHNTGETRKILCKWGKQQINLGNLEEWSAEVEDADFASPCKYVVLWIDSSDLRLMARKGYTRKSPYWSFKLNRPGRRYTMMRDYAGKFRKVWGGYTPKLSDFEFVEVFKDWFETYCANASIIGDCHYAVKLENVNFVVPHRDLSEPKGASDVKISKLTKKQQKENKIIRELRARIETPFGILKNKFNALKKPWAEDVEQMDCLVYYACGIMNFEK